MNVKKINSINSQSNFKGTIICSNRKSPLLKQKFSFSEIFSGNADSYYIAYRFNSKLKNEENRVANLGSPDEILHLPKVEEKDVIESILKYTEEKGLYAVIKEIKEKGLKSFIAKHTSKQ